MLFVASTANLRPQSRPAALTSPNLNTSPIPVDLLFDERINDGCEFGDEAKGNEALDIHEEGGGDEGLQYGAGT